MESFYRVQDSAGIGPYQNSANVIMGNAHSWDRSHYTPAVHGYFMKYGELCGFRTMQDLFRWFGGWLPSLIDDGYRVVKVSGTVTYEDPYQVVFVPATKAG